MEHISVKNEFGDKVEVKPIIIVPESSHSEDNVFVTSIKAEEILESTTFHQGSEVNNSETSPAVVGTVDDIKRWNVPSSVILQTGETEDGFYVEPADIPTGGVLWADSLKNENTDTSDACELNEHNGQLAFIPNLTMNPPELTTDSDVLALQWHSNEQFNKSSTADSQVKTLSEPASITDGKFALNLGHVLCRDSKALDETPDKIKGNSFCSESFVDTVTESSSGQTARNEMSEFSNVIQQSHSQSGKRLFKCYLCDNSFVTAGNLSVHLRNCTGIRPYKCDVCKNTFTKLCYLTEHQRIHTGEKPYKCDVCDKKFSRAYVLREHRYIHTGEKPYKCDVCKKTFTKLSNLTSHQRIHTGEKPYACDVCDKKFSRACVLREHRYIHTGEKIYKCDVCDKGFNDSGNFSRHKRIHTDEKCFK